MKRSITVPLVGLGLGATALGGAAWYGSGSRCTEGKVVDSLAQCSSIVGSASAALCATAFGAFSPANEQVSLTGPAPNLAQRAVFVTTRPDGQPTALPVTRAGGDTRWRNQLGETMSPFRNSCSRGSSTTSSSSSRSSGSSGSGVNSGYSSSNTSVSRGGFGSSGSGFSGG